MRLEPMDTSTKTQPPHDFDLPILRGIVPCATDANLRAKASSVYFQHAVTTRWAASASPIGKALWPLALASVVGLYMTWADTAATAVVM